MAEKVWYYGKKVLGKDGVLDKATEVATKTETVLKGGKILKDGFDKLLGKEKPVIKPKYQKFLEKARKEIMAILQEAKLNFKDMFEIINSNTDRLSEAQKKVQNALKNKLDEIYDHLEKQTVHSTSAVLKALQFTDTQISEIKGSVNRIDKNVVLTSMNVEQGFVENRVQFCKVNTKIEETRQLTLMGFAELKKEVSSLRKNLEQKDHVISNQSTVLAKMTEIIVEKDSELSDIRTENERLKKELEKKQRR